MMEAFALAEVAFGLASLVAVMSGWERLGCSLLVACGVSFMGLMLS